MLIIGHCRRQTHPVTFMLHDGKHGDKKKSISSYRAGVNEYPCFPSNKGFFSMLNRPDAWLADVMQLCKKIKREK